MLTTFILEMCPQHLSATRVVPFVVVLLLNSQLFFQTRASPLFPQDDDTDDTTEDVDDVYDEEEAASTTTPASENNEEEELDPDEKEDADVRQILSQRLGITNFSSKALAEKASHFVIKYLVGITPTDPPKRRTKLRTRPPTPAAVTSKKYAIRKTTATSVEATSVPNTSNGTNQLMRSFVITVPKGENGTGGVIEINLPMPLSMKSPSEMEMPDHHTSLMSISSGDELGLKNIEAAIMEALVIAQQMSTMTMSTSMENATEIIELDVGEVHLPGTEAGAESVTEAGTTGDTSNSSSSTPSPSTLVQVEARGSEGTAIDPPTTTGVPPSVTKRPTRRRVRSTTIRGPSPDDRFGVGPVTDIIVSQIRTGQLPQFLWKSVMKLANSRYAQIAVDAVECAVFYYCPDDVELGTLSKKGKF